MWKEKCWSLLRWNRHDDGIFVFNKAFIIAIGFIGDSSLILFFSKLNNSDEDE